MSKKTAPNTLGLVGKIRDIHEQLTAKRKEGYHVTLPGAFTRGLLTINGQKAKDELSIDKLLHDLGIDKRDTLAAVVALPEDQRWIVPEFFLETIEQGMRQQNDFFRNLLAGTVEVPQLEVQQPQVGFYSTSGQGLNAGATGTTPEDATQVIFSNRAIKTEKFERVITIPHEAQRYSTLDQMQTLLTRVSKVWGLQLTRQIIDVLQNGDQLDASQAAGTIGVKDTTNKLQWFDLSRISVRAARLGFNYNTVVTNEDGVLRFLNLPEIKENQFSGQPLATVRVNGRVPGSYDLWPHSAPASGKFIFLDNKAAVQEIIAEGLRVETERLMERDITRTYVRIQHGFTNLWREARVVVDENTAFTSFPSFMAPID